MALNDEEATQELIKQLDELLHKQGVDPQELDDEADRLQPQAKQLLNEAKNYHRVDPEFDKMFDDQLFNVALSHIMANSALPIQYAIHTTMMAKAVAALVMAYQARL